MLAVANEKTVFKLNSNDKQFFIEVKGLTFR